MVRFLLPVAVVAFATPAFAQGAPATLDALVERALAQHPSLVRASQNAEASEARVGVATSRYYPQVGISAGMNRTTTVSQTQTANAPFSLGSSGLSVRQQIFDFGKTAASIDAAAAAARASEQQLALQGVEVAYGVRRAFTEWVRARGVEAAARVRLQAADRLLAQARAFQKAGTRPKIEVVRAEASRGQAASDLIAAENGVAIAKRTLDVALGTLTPVTAVAAFPALPAVASQPPGELIQLASDRHPSLKVAAARLEGAEAEVRGAERAGWPDLNANANYGNRLRELDLSQNWQAGLSFDMPLFTGFQISHQQAAATASYQATEADVRDAALTLQLGVERAVLALSGARKRQPAAEGVLRSAQENLRLAEGRYKAGVGTVIEVSDAQALLASAQSEALRAEADVHLAAADLLRAVGLTGLER